LRGYSSKARQLKWGRPTHLSRLGAALIAFLDKSECGGFIAKTHIGQSEITQETNIFRLLLRKVPVRARLLPTFLSSGTITANFLRPT